MADQHSLCLLSGDVSIATDGGAVALRDAMGKELLSPGRAGAYAPVSAEEAEAQPALKVTLARGSEERSVLAGARHKWLAKKDGGLMLYETFALYPGLRIPSAGEGIAASGEESEDDWIVASVSEESGLAASYRAVSSAGAFTLEGGILACGCD